MVVKTTTIFFKKKRDMNIEMIITCLIILLVVVLLSYVLFKLNEERLKNNILIRQVKENADKLTTYQTKLASLTPNELSFVDKMKHDFNIKQVLFQIANMNDEIIFSSGFLFHNGGNIPTQLSMLYEEHKMGVDVRFIDTFQGLRTCEMYQQILLILDSRCMRMNSIEPKSNKFCQLLDECQTKKFLAFVIKYDEKTPVMFIGVHLKEGAAIDENLISKISNQVDSIKPDVIKLFAHKLKYYENHQSKAN